MSSDPEVRHPLLNDRRKSETFSDGSGGPQLCTLSDHLGIDEMDAFQEFSSSRSSNEDRKKRKKGRESPTVYLTQDQVDNLIETLENTGNTLKQLTYRGSGEHSPHRRPRIPRWIITHLLMITALWQITGILALTISKAITGHKKEERSTFISTIIVLVVIQALNLLLVFITSVKLTKQFLHHTVTKSFLAQSYLSMTLLYAGLYTLVYNIKHESFEATELKMNDSSIFSSFILFAEMLYYSISMATLCGAGHIVASTWYSQLISASQMLMSYVYFASVLTIAVHPPKKIQYAIGQRRDRITNPSRAYGSIQNV